MPIKKIDHYSVRTANLEVSRQFYVEVLGFKVGYRPPLKFPGFWLYPAGGGADYGLVHLIGTEGAQGGLTEYLGSRDGAGEGGGALDHLAFLATDFIEFRDRLTCHQIAFRERALPGLNLHQLFFRDPSGITIEMNFPVAAVGLTRSLADHT